MGLLLMVYLGLLGFVTTITPGAGICGQLIASLPYGTSDVLHVPAYAVLTWILIRWLEGRGWPHRYAYFTGAVGATVVGLWVEVLQGSIPGRATEATDLMMNSLGVSIAMFLILRQGFTIDRAVLIFPAKACGSRR